MSLTKIYNRAPDGRPIPERDGPPIPDATLFWNPIRGAYTEAEIVHGWRWSTGMLHWRALVTFVDRWSGETSPKTW